MWKNGVGRNDASVPKDTFLQLLKNLMDVVELNSPENIKAGFKQCGTAP
jgi:hypothetical protein